MMRIPETIPERKDAEKRGGPRSALRLVGPDEDPRILSTNADLFFRKPSPIANALGLVALIIGSALTIGSYFFALWDAIPLIPWLFAVLTLVVWCLPVALLWWLWISRQRSNAKVRQGRNALAALVKGTPPERCEAIKVSYTDSDPVIWRTLDIFVVTGFSGGQAVFVDGRVEKRWDVFAARFRTGDPVWLWRSEDGWLFGQITMHGLDPTYSPDCEPVLPTWEEQLGGHSPQYFATGLAELAARYRSGELSRKEYQIEVDRLIGTRQ